MIASAFGCPFEGEVTADHVLALAEKLLTTPPDTFGVADSIGVGVPVQIKRSSSPWQHVWAISLCAAICTTRATPASANALTAIEYGATRIDASTGGIGGCPFAPAATGNIATEDLLYGPAA